MMALFTFPSLAEYLGWYVLAAIVTSLCFAGLMAWAEHQEECRDRQKG